MTIEKGSIVYVKSTTSTYHGRYGFVYRVKPMSHRCYGVMFWVEDNQRIAWYGKKALDDATEGPIPNRDPELHQEAYRDARRKRDSFFTPSLSPEMLREVRGSMENGYSDEETVFTDPSMFAPRSSPSSARPQASSDLDALKAEIQNLTQSMSALAQAFTNLQSVTHSELAALSTQMHNVGERLCTVEANQASVPDTISITTDM